MIPILQDGAPEGSMVVNNQSGWMEKGLFLQWIKHFHASVNSTKVKHVLILDGRASHTKGHATRNDIVDDIVDVSSSTMAFNVAKIASARSSLTISLTKSLRVAGPEEFRSNQLRTRQWHTYAVTAFSYNTQEATTRSNVLQTAHDKLQCCC